MSHPIRTLVVEDRADDWMLVRRSLNGGYECTNAASLAEALAALRDHVFDLVIADLSLPDVAGGQHHIGVEALRLAAPELPIVVVTGESLGASACGALVRAGATTVAVKGVGPEHAEHLNAQVTAAIERERIMLVRLSQAADNARLATEGRIVGAVEALAAEVRSLIDILKTSATPPTPPLEDAGVALGQETGGLVVRIVRRLGPWGRRLLAGLLTSGGLAGWRWLPPLVSSCTPPEQPTHIEGEP